MKSVMNEKVLQLQASYEPDGIITVWRAINLLHTRKDDRGRPKAEQLHAYPGLIARSFTHEYEVPSVIRLVTYHDLRRKRRESNKRRSQIFMRDKYRCQYCGIRVGSIHPELLEKLRVEHLTLDHIMPSSRGGSDEADNLATSCKPCNNRKDNRTPDEARMPLIATPSALRYGLSRAEMLHYAQTREVWHQYLFLTNEKIA
jgi:5-methylcytosine-specific restriction endonuclease McrA